MLHLGKHAAQRQFDLKIELVCSLLLQLLRKHLIQRLNGCCFAHQNAVRCCVLRGWRRKMQIILGKRRERVLASRRVEEIGGNGSVEHKTVDGKSLCKQSAHQRLAVMGHLSDLRRQQLPQDAFIRCAEPLLRVEINHTLRLRRVDREGGEVLQEM